MTVRANQLGSRIRAGFLFGLLILVINVAVVYSSMQTLISNISGITQGHVVLTAIERVLSALQDAETGQRGYILTLDPEYLEQYELALAQLDTELANLERASHNDPLMQANLPTLHALIDDRLETLGVVTRARQTAGLDAAQAIVASGRGKTQMEAVQGLITSMKNDESRAVQQRSAESAASSRRTIASFTVVVLFDLLLLLLVYVLVVRDLQRHSRDRQTAALYAQRLRALSRQLLEVQESERRHIARELHDQIGQILTAVKICLQAIRNEPEKARFNRYLDDGVESVEQALQQVRDLSLSLRPLLLDDLGLVAALRWHLDRQAQRSGFETSLRFDVRDARLPQEIENACFRVAQEALTNVARHAQARHVTVELKQQPTMLILTLADDGVGFEYDHAQQENIQRRSQGLITMQERVHLLGGNMRIETGPGAGTRILASFPLAGEAANNTLGGQNQ